LSGFETARGDDLAVLAAALERALGVPRIAIASDGVTSLLGALGERPGCVVAAGTGTIVVARHGSNWAKVDGWGAVLGDAGSGFAIGRAGMDAALRAKDGRGGSAELRRRAEEMFGDLDDMPALVRRTPSWSRTIAGFAVEVARAADGGDPVAIQVLGAAAAELATSACAALERVYPPGERAVVSYLGNVFKAGPLLLDAFVAELELRRPGTELVEPAGDSLAGAALLPGTPAEPGLVWSAA
jgi:N-acetylglucosamine kinase-like BadF-type ATPase